MSNSIIDINKILDEYVDDIQEAIEEVSLEIAEEGKNKLKNTNNTYKIRSGKYNKGWKIKTNSSKNYISNTIHNSSQYRLTHLLENGHVAKNKYETYGRVKAYPHIKEVNDYCVNKFQREVEQIIKKGGK